MFAVFALSAKQNLQGLSAGRNVSFPGMIVVTPLKEPYKSPLKEPHKSPLKGPLCRSPISPL